MVAGGSDEHLCLVLETAKRLAMDDPIAIALKRRPQAAYGLFLSTDRWVGPRGRWRELTLLARTDPLLKRVRDRPGRMSVSSCHELLAHASDSDSAARRGTFNRKSTRLNSSHANISYAVF